MQIWFLSNGSYSLKKCHNPFGKAIQPPPLTAKFRLNTENPYMGLPLLNWAGKNLYVGSNTGVNTKTQKIHIRSQSVRGIAQPSRQGCVVTSKDRSRDTNENTNTSI